MLKVKKLLKESLPGMRNAVPTNSAVKNSQKATTYVGKGVLKNGGGVPDGPLVKKKGEFKGSTLKEGGSIVKAGGQTHKVFKNKKGDVVVDHTAGPSAGKWDKINLTKKAKAKTVKQGVASVKKWHKDNPDYYKKKKK